jgi:8-oxo-dGTP pyrophosphatase MutT (NUDIX family)
MMREISRNIVSAVIMSLDKKILFGRQDASKGGAWLDCWHIPGGGIEAGETREQALIREVQEEVGLDISAMKIELLDDSQKRLTEKVLRDTGETVLCHMQFSDYMVKINELAKNIITTPSDDLIDLTWFSVAELATIKLTPPSVELFGKMGLLKT